LGVYRDAYTYSFRCNYTQRREKIEARLSELSYALKKMKRGGGKDRLVLFLSLSTLSASRLGKEKGSQLRFIIPFVGRGEALKRQSPILSLMGAERKKGFRALRRGKNPPAAQKEGKTLAP